MLKKNPKVEKLYYSIGEVSELFEVNASLLRFWETEFDILHPKKNKKGNRLYSKQDIESLKLIYHLVRERGYTLPGAREKIRQNREGIEKNMEIVESLEKIKDVLLRIKSGI